jgi:hypothetical protein
MSNFQFDHIPRSECRPPWRAPEVVVVGQIRDVVLSSMAKGSPGSDGADNSDSRKNTHSAEPHG